MSTSVNILILRREIPSSLESVPVVPAVPKSKSMLLPSIGGYELGKGGPSDVAVAVTVAFLRSMILCR